MYTARVTDDLRLVYQIKPEYVEVVLLLSAGAVEYLRGTKSGAADESPNGTP
jgi:hypothetical protein